MLPTSPQWQINMGLLLLLHSVHKYDYYVFSIIICFRKHVTSTVRFKRENPDLSLLDFKFCNMQGFGANMELSFMKYGSFMHKFPPFETFVKIT